MKTPSVIFALFVTMLLTACGSEGPSNPSDPAGGGAPITEEPPTASPIPSPVPSASPSPSCKPLKSTWGTQTVPSSQAMGVYLGPSTSNPVFTLDLTQLQDGISTFVYDETHVCYYDTTLLANGYRFNAFWGCNPGTGGAYQCGYCPLTDSQVRTFTYTKSCTALTITDPTTNTQVTYE